MIARARSRSPASPEILAVLCRPPVQPDAVAGDQRDRTFEPSRAYVVDRGVQARGGRRIRPSDVHAPIVLKAERRQARESQRETASIVEPFVDVDRVADDVPAVDVLRAGRETNVPLVLAHAHVRVEGPHGEMVGRPRGRRPGDRAGGLSGGASAKLGALAKTFQARKHLVDLGLLPNLTAPGLNGVPPERESRADRGWARIVGFVSAFTAEEREGILQSLMKRHRLRRADAEALFAGRERPTKRNPIMERQWASLLHRMCTAIRNDAAEPRGIFQSIFWIRLYGALTEIRDRFDKFPGLRASIPTTSAYHRWATAGAEVFDACTAIRESLSHDELVFAAFLRHVHAHVYQEGFEYDLEPGNAETGQRGAVRGSTMVRPVRRHIGVNEVHAIVDRVHVAHDHDESRIAAAFAAKVGPGIERLDRAMSELAVVIAELDAAELSST